MNESVIVTDTKGSLLSEIGPVLEAHGYRVMSIDFADMSSSTGYNPLDYVRRDPRTGKLKERDIMKIATVLCPVEDQTQPFWENAAKGYIAMLIGYVLEFLPEEERNLASVAKLAGGLQPKGDKMPTGTTGVILDALLESAPDSFAARKWVTTSPGTGAEKMHCSILGILNEKLDFLVFDDTVSMFSCPDRIDFRDLGREKTALFLTVSDTDRSMDRIVTLLYMQALQALCDYADKKCVGYALPIPVRMFLDDFATNAVIPDFDQIISVIRSRNIAVSVILQSVTQLDSLYGVGKARTIINGCDHLLYLGGQDIETARFVGVKAHKTVDTVLDQDLDTVWLFERGRRAETVQLFDLTTHPLYFELPEACEEFWDEEETPRDDMGR